MSPKCQQNAYYHSTLTSCSIPSIGAVVCEACYFKQRVLVIPKRQRKRARPRRTKGVKETRQGISMKPTSEIKVSFFLSALISLFQWEVAVLVFNHSVSFMCPLKRCAAVLANQLRSSAAQRAHGRRAVCLSSPFANTEPRLIQHHSPFFSSTQGGGCGHLASATGDRLYGVLNGDILPFRLYLLLKRRTFATLLLMPVSSVHHLYEEHIRLLCSLQWEIRHQLFIDKYVHLLGFCLTSHRERQRNKAILLKSYFYNPLIAMAFLLSCCIKQFVSSTRNVACGLH